MRQKQPLLPYQRSALSRNQQNDILILSRLFAYRQKNGHSDISFAAGLPGHSQPTKIKKIIASIAQQESSAYPDYDPKAPITSETLKPKIAAFHTFHFGSKIKAEETGFAPGSTAILKAVAAIAGNDYKVAILPHPGYPLIKEPLIQARSHISLYASIEPNTKTKRWQLSLENLAAALKYHRVDNSFLYFNFPSNPTGYSPTAEEYQEIVKILMQEIEKRQKLNSPPPCILEDQAYALMMHENRCFYSIFNAIDDIRKQTISQALCTKNKKQLELLDILEQSVVVAHSFSKTFAAAGDRVAYWVCKNEKMRKSLTAEINAHQLTPSRTSLAVANAILEEKQYDKNAMNEYGQRLRHLETSLNEAFSRAKKINKTLQKTTYDPIKAHADAGFFATADFSFLKNLTVPREMVKKIKEQLSLSQEGAENINIFQNNRINNSFDASLWLLANSSLLAIPIKPTKHFPDQIYLRFSVGTTTEKDIDLAMEKLTKALIEISPEKETISRL